MINSRHWRLAVAGIVTAALSVVPGPVSAQDTADEDARLIIDALTAAGVPAELIDEDFHQRVRAAVRELVDDGVIDREALDELREVVADGRLRHTVEERVERGRERRDAYRDAAEEVLLDLGVELAAGQSIREALTDAGYGNDEVRDLLPNRRRVACDRQEARGCDHGEPDGRPGRDRTRDDAPDVNDEPASHEPLRGDGHGTDGDEMEGDEMDGEGVNSDEG